MQLTVHVVVQQACNTVACRLFDATVTTLATAADSGAVSKQARCADDDIILLRHILTSVYASYEVAEVSTNSTVPMLSKHLTKCVNSSIVQQQQCFGTILEVCTRVVLPSSSLTTIYCTNVLPLHLTVACLRQL
eukprot:10574-Heterococcus_DN1.PRE.3